MNAPQNEPGQFDQLKQRMKASWMAGDFGQVAKYTAVEAVEFIARLPIGDGMDVLDVACGTGNLTIPAARTGANAIGVDIATNLLEQARARAAVEGLATDFRAGDAEQLPFRDATFDVVVTMFGAMFAPRPELVARELARVCRPGGLIAMANWTPEGFVGKTFAVTSRFVPPPAGIPAPVMWGKEEVVCERFAAVGCTDVETARRNVLFRYPFGAARVVQFFREYFGPTQTAFARLDAAGQAAMAGELEKLWVEHNEGPDDESHVKAEYLEVRVTKPD
jgi:ubiquinone/menaquinone biosynthesis C-methylase UbiE